MKSLQNKKALYWTALIVFVLLIFWVVIGILKNVDIRLRYQASKSMPQGLYLQYPSAEYKVGDNIIFYPEQLVEKLMLDRGWISYYQPLLKSIVAQKGDTVCIKNNQLLINKKSHGSVYLVDSKGRKLPRVNICRELQADEFWVQGKSSDHSFDSRYFGVVTQKQIEGKVVLL
ncbi:signal peptidase I [Thiotrichales bacterium 19S9-12]|nr:signal peptidase I [Thiotrichales bacterium 19S9-11]MCF6812178.1 signal peptidase I [Thiotrichales bacterium 19S9-12]